MAELFCEHGTFIGLGAGCYTCNLEQKLQIAGQLIDRLRERDKDLVDSTVKEMEQFLIENRDRPQVDA